MVASCSSVEHIVQLERGKEEVRLGGSGCTCCRGSAEPAGFVRLHIGSSACLRMQHAEQLALVAVAPQLVAAAVAAVCSCLRIAAVLEHQVLGTCSSLT